MSLPIEEFALAGLFRRVSDRVRRASPWDSHDPIREERFSVERIEEHARSLAEAQIVAPKPARGHPLAKRLAENGAVLLNAYQAWSKPSTRGVPSPRQRNG
jgi:cyclic beta-1,2-glucan synthetase